MKSKYYKPGQLITIDGKVYRLKKGHNIPFICMRCAIQPYCHITHAYCMIFHCDYLELVKPKQK